METISIAKKNLALGKIGWSALALTGVAACVRWQWKWQKTAPVDERRVLCSDLLAVRWQTGSEQFEGVANLEEIWPSGAIISLDQEIAVGTEVALVTPTRDFRGTVASAHDDELGGYLIELRFFAANPWSMELYEPEHSLDPSALFPTPDRVPPASKE